MKKIKDNSPYQTLGYKIDKPTERDSYSPKSGVTRGEDLRIKRGKK